jgi:uncharacterized membrane protein YfcA
MSLDVRAAGVGLIAGIAGGLFGVGGGVVIVPALVVWFGLDQHRAHATSLAAITAIAAAALVPFVADGAVDVGAGIALLGGAAVGAYGGARMMARISPVWLARGFFTLLVVAAVRMFMA